MDTSLTKACSQLDRAWFKRSEMNHDEPLQSFAYNFNLRHYAEAVKLEPLAPGAAKTKRLAQLFKGDAENVLKKKYQPHFAWGQLCSWYKQTIYDPSASLSADRRGVAWQTFLATSQSAFQLKGRGVNMRCMMWRAKGLVDVACHDTECH